MKNDKGITLVILVITIIVMLIIVGITSYSGINTAKNMRVTKFVTTMQAIQKQVDIYAEKNERVGTEINFDSSLLPRINGIIENTLQNQELLDNSAKDLNYITTNMTYFDSASIKTYFNLDFDNELLVDWQTREVIGLVGVEYKDIIYYTQYKLPNGQILKNQNISNRELSFDFLFDNITNKGTISNVSINNGTLKYRYTDDNENKWQQITNYTETDKNYVIDLNPNYVYKIKLIDNITKLEWLYEEE